MKIPKQWIHIGSREINSNEFDSVRNVPLFPKPTGGLWASPLTLSSPYRSDWHKLCMNLWGKSRKKHSVLFEFKKNAKIFVIDSQGDLIQLIEEVGKAHDPLAEQLPFRRYCNIDFENAQNSYDVIYLTARGQYQTRNPLLKEEYNLYGWDCESCLILNMDVIHRQIPASL